MYRMNVPGECHPPLFNEWYSLDALHWYFSPNAPTECPPLDALQLYGILSKANKVDQQKLISKPSGKLIRKIWIEMRFRTIGNTFLAPTDAVLVLAAVLIAWDHAFWTFLQLLGFATFPLRGYFGSETTRSCLRELFGVPLNFKVWNSFLFISVPFPKARKPGLSSVLISHLIGKLI